MICDTVTLSMALNATSKGRRRRGSFSRTGLGAWLCGSACGLRVNSRTRKALAGSSDMIWNGRLRLCRASSAASAGPTTRPTALAAPSEAMARARRCGSTWSAISALQPTGMAA
ncbi:hypothetical protein D3C85_1610020 [compost metagenome]